MICRGVARFFAATLEVAGSVAAKLVAVPETAYVSLTLPPPQGMYPSNRSSVIRGLLVVVAKRNL
jgi:hypothetical protein